MLEGLDMTGLADNTIIVVVSGHGEEFNEHGFISHGQSNFGTVTDVPPIIVGPRFKSGCLIKERVMNIDIMPTILDLCGIAVPECAKGISLAASVRGNDQPELLRRPIFSEGAWNGFVGAVWVGPYKYLLDQKGRPHLFNLQTDPKETLNMVREMPDLAVELEQMLFLHKREG